MRVHRGRNPRDRTQAATIFPFDWTVANRSEMLKEEFQDFRVLAAFVSTIGPQHALARQEQLECPVKFACETELGNEGICVQPRLSRLRGSPELVLIGHHVWLPSSESCGRGRQTGEGVPALPAGPTAGISRIPEVRFYPTKRFRTGRNSAPRPVG